MIKWMQGRLCVVGLLLLVLSFSYLSSTIIHLSSSTMGHEILLSSFACSKIHIFNLDDRFI